MPLIFSLGMIERMNALARYRKKSGLTMRELAPLLGLKSPGHVADLISGKQPMSVKVAKALSELTGTPWHEIIDGQKSDAA